MKDQRLDRRQILKGAGALGAAGALAALHPALAQAEGGDDTRSSIQGAWHVTGSDGTILLFGYAAGGVLIRTLAGEPAGQFPSGPAIGAWRKSIDQPNKYIGTYFVLFSDPSGKFTGTGKVRSQVALSEDGNTFSGAFVFEFFLPGATNPDFGNTGTLAGRRVVAEAP